MLEISVTYKQTIVVIYKNHNEITTLQAPENMQPGKLVHGQFCDCVPTCKPMYKPQQGFFEEERELKLMRCVSDDYCNLQEKKPHRIVVRVKLREIFIANIEEESALDLKFGNEKVSQAVRFLCFLQKLDLIQKIQ